jgi:DNA-binding protein WhiA
LSFSSRVKEEICRYETVNECCINSEFVGIVFALGRDTLGVRFTTESAVLARKIYSSFKTTGNKEVKINTSNSSGIKKRILYSLVFGELSLDINKMKTFMERYEKHDCCKRAFLKGLFLAVGSINSPKKNYHLELSFGRKDILDITLQLTSYYNLKTKMIERKGNYVVYSKDSESIVDFLNIIGAHKALMEIENLRILKNMKSNVNRIVNCETANLDKMLNASFRQIEDIIVIKNHMGLESLPHKIRQVAKLRMINKSSNLKELGELLQPPIGKSGVNHRLKKIKIIADKIRNNNEENKND